MPLAHVVPQHDLIAAVLVQEQQLWFTQQGQWQQWCWQPGKHKPGQLQPWGQEQWQLEPW